MRASGGIWVFVIKERTKQSEPNGHGGYRCHEHDKSKAESRDVEIIAPIGRPKRESGPDKNPREKQESDGGEQNLVLACNPLKARAIEEISRPLNEPSEGRTDAIADSSPYRLGHACTGDCQQERQHPNGYLAHDRVLRSGNAIGAALRASTGSL